METSIILRGTFQDSSAPVGRPFPFNNNPLSVVYGDDRPKGTWSAFNANQSGFLFYLVISHMYHQLPRSFQVFRIPLVLPRNNNMNYEYGFSVQTNYRHHIQTSTYLFSFRSCVCVCVCVKKWYWPRPKNVNSAKTSANMSAPAFHSGSTTPDHSNLFQTSFSISVIRNAERCKLERYTWASSIVIFAIVRIPESLWPL